MLISNLTIASPLMFCVTHCLKKCYLYSLWQLMKISLNDFCAGFWNPESKLTGLNQSVLRHYERSWTHVTVINHYLCLTLVLQSEIVFCSSCLLISRYFRLFTTIACISKNIGALDFPPESVSHVLVQARDFFMDET